MAARPFPAGWFTPTAEARRAAAALAEGFCAYPECGYPFDEGMHCPVCGVTWELTATGFSAEVREDEDTYRKVTVYPFADWHKPPVIELG